MKFLLVLAVVFVAIWIWRKNRRDDMRERQPPKRATTPAVAAPQAMLRCAHCGLHLPAADAIGGPGGIAYCSVAHRQAAGH
ncbi:hypothetical protein SRS16CHR_00941 [Variovorax sp. SRS16]|uniref:PP0621 family protein n=1 Tax=Variovorax sp. SRS16 TaxID=282217 RepID=UPI0013181CE5|nr:PP0621 family protein [Variovorax sp. SRS16]VTU14137.1 hypothetical protein SRS16CHR_00941 [Variovorax sp. SRS16]